jgi:hypothetical protein
VFNWFRTANAAVTIIKILLALAATSGGAMTLALLREVPWYEATVFGCVLTAALIMSIVGIDYLWRTHTISKKVAIWQLRVVIVEIDAVTKKLSVQLVAHLKNRAIRPVYYDTVRVNCHIDKLTYDKMIEQPKPLEIQPGNSGGIPIQKIYGLDPMKQAFEGRAEFEFKYGKSADKLKRTYKTTGIFIIYVFPTPSGIPMAHLETIGGTASYE